MKFKENSLITDVLARRLKRQRTAIKTIVTQLELLENGKRVLETQKQCEHLHLTREGNNITCNGCGFKL